MHNHLLTTRVEAHIEALPEVICCRCILSCMETRSSPYFSEVYILDAMQAFQLPIGRNLISFTTMQRTLYGVGRGHHGWHCVGYRENTWRDKGEVECVGHGGIYGKLLLLSFCSCARRGFRMNENCLRTYQRRAKPCDLTA